MNRKYLPLILMLASGLVTLVITFVNGYSILWKLLILFGDFVVFFFLGTLIVNVLNRFDKENQEALRAQQEAEAAAEAERLAAEGAQDSVELKDKSK